MPLPLAGNEGCLEADSFLELRGIVEYDDIELDEKLRTDPTCHLGQLSAASIRDLLANLMTAKTVTPEERQIIRTSLESCRALRNATP